jgi:uncharacterized protein YyaL (SSP411 family)
MTAERNRLDAETSPYLLQHAHNPVHWWAWGEDALAEAQRTNRPILLSVGYAACHWCHVMAHESFESPEVAAVMNELFVNIKVDREERPDVDAIYMQALHLLGEQGGWPLTMFCTPAGEPFWGGTYFPYPARYGRPSFVDVLHGVAQAWRDKPQDIETNRAGLLKALQAGAANRAVVPSGDGPLIPMTLLDQIAARLAQECDPEWGGFGKAPKFPSPYMFELIWRGWLRGRKDRKLFEAVTVTLDRMSQGGIYDHLAGGFARYATDAHWLIPHFEKMLYDNAQLIDLLTLVWQETKSPLYAARIAETCDWTLREMVAPSGGFAASYDADSEGVEGKFYVWDVAEIDSVLGSEDGAFFRGVYDVTPEGNWEHHNILHRNKSPTLLSNADDAADLIVRGKHCHDNAVPAGNGTLVGVFARLWILTGDPAWHDKADRQVAAFAGELESNFFPLMTLLNGYETLQSAIELVIVGDRAAPATEALRRAVYAKSLPNKVVRRLAPDAALPADHPAAGKGLVDGKPALYVCRNLSCEAPVTDPAALSL